MYEEDLRQNEIIRLNWAMMIPPEKEWEYIRQIDALKLECAELWAENYNLGEKFIKHELWDKNLKIQIEEQHILK